MTKRIAAHEQNIKYDINMNDYESNVNTFVYRKPGIISIQMRDP